VRDRLRQTVEARFSSGLQIFVHCAADLLHCEIERVRIDELRRVVEANIVAPFALLQSLTPLFGRGSTVVLLNSSHGLAAPARTGPYAATKYALRALADAYRDEVNARGIRVLSIYCGKTATEMQQRIYRDRGQASRYGEIEDHILQPDDVAAIIVSTVALPQTAEVTDIQIRPLMKT
jgi:NAD(P)-dependent dehydrogenase (short-subunit alcohol dehydrogenase family)